jgi:predicted Fe-Mo cluster-binding NifX family protein
MRLAIATDGTTLESEVCPSFGRTETFLIVDTETLEVEVLPNAAAHAQGGAGIVAAQALVDAGVDAAVALYLGQNAADVLTSAGVPVYKGVPGTAAETVRRFNANELTVLKDVHPGHHRHGK